MVKRSIKMALSVIWLTVSLFVGVSIFTDIGGWMYKLIIDQNITTNEKFTGGEIAFQSNYDGYIVFVHEPVYEGVFKKSKEPSVQIDFLALEELPKHIDAILDITGDSVKDISIRIDKTEESVVFEPLRSDIKGLLDKGSLVGLKRKLSKNIYDGFFYYKDKGIDEVNYSEGISVRVVFGNAIRD